MDKERPAYVLENREGHVNYMPGPWREITEKDFWHRVAVWGFSKNQDYYQPLIDKNPELYSILQGNEYNGRPYMHSVTVLYYHTDGVAIVWGVKGAIPYPEKFLEIGCDHKGSTGTDTIRGYHTRECSICGLKWSWDSSD